MPAFPENRSLPPAKAPSEEALEPEVYHALRGIAARYLAGDARRVTLTPTVLVHEAWLRLESRPRGTWKSLDHRKAVIARAMRHVLIDRARSARANHRHVTISGALFAIEESELDLAALGSALERLEVEDPRSAKVVELMFFGGLEQREVADILGVGLRTVQGDWAYARSWLLRELER